MNRKDYQKESLALHRKLAGKISICNKTDVRDIHDLSMVYSPGVAQPCLEIARDPSQVYSLTMKSNSVAVVTDGSAVLGLGNIGASASLPVMEGKCMLFKKFAGIDAFPICLDTQDTDEIINIVKKIAPVFGGINLEDISAPRCFKIEQELQSLGIPVFHDDKHGTAIVVLAGLINASRVIKKPLSEMRVVINGAGAAGVAITKLLSCVNVGNERCNKVKEVVICDSKGILHSGRNDLSAIKRSLLEYTNPADISGDLMFAMKDADVFIGVSKGNILTANHVRNMSDSPVIFALANPVPEIYPDEAKQAGAVVVATGRSDFPNQVNNVLAFPGIFKAALELRAKTITPAMKIATANALADMLEKPDYDNVIMATLSEKIADKVAERIRKTFFEENNKKTIPL